MAIALAAAPEWLQIAARLPPCFRRLAAFAYLQRVSSTHERKLYDIACGLGEQPDAGVCAPNFNWAPASATSVCRNW